MELNLSLPGAKYKLPVTITPHGGRLELKYPFSKAMNEEIKAMEGCRYHGYDEPPRKMWSVSDTPRNWFQLRYLAGEPVFSRYDMPLVEISKDLYPGSYPHQFEMCAHGLTRRRTIFAFEMGVGKTLGGIMIMEQSGHSDWWWIGTKGSLREMPGEFRKWKSKVTPKFYTYDELKKVMENWPVGKKAPHGVIFDEASKLKTPTSQRSVAGLGLSIGIEKDWGIEGYCILMTGTPAPKDPCDWWHLCEVAKPGFIREGTIQKFKKRLSLTQTKQGEYGQYPEHVTWWDDERKCSTCGLLQDDKNANHNLEKTMLTGDTYHQYAPSKNEVKNLYERMKGLVLIKFKKDVLKHLPEKRYHLEKLEPSKSILRTAKTILKTSRNTITGLTKLRELSDGFQYTEVADGLDQCPRCTGTGKHLYYYKKDNPEQCIFDCPPESYDDYQASMGTCTECDGKCQVTKYIRTMQEIPCPKDDYLTHLLELHEDVGRFITFAGFTGSIDRCCNISRKNGWATIRVDGRGWFATDYQGTPIDVKGLFGTDKGDPYLQLFQHGHEQYPRVNFVGHPGSGGLGVTLTASNGIFYWSNDFNAEYRIQSEDRNHRPGMDLNLGGNIYDCVHLPTDELVLENLKKKKALQSMTLGVFVEALESAESERIV